MAVEAEGAERPGEPRHFAKKFFGMTVFRQQNMPQWSQTGVDGMQKPELSDLAGRHASLEFSTRLLLLLRDDGALLLQNFDQSLQHGGKPLVRTQAQTRLDMGRIVDDVTGLIAHHSGAGKR